MESLYFSLKKIRFPQMEDLYKLMRFKEFTLEIPQKILTIAASSIS